jgi:hypothetical protein
MGSITSGKTEYEIAHRHVFDHRARNAQTKAADQQATIEAKILIAFIVHCHGAPSFLAFAQQLSAFQTKAPYRQIASVRFCAKLSSASCRDYARRGGQLGGFSPGGTTPQCQD